MQINWPF